MNNARNNPLHFWISDNTLGGRKGGREEKEEREGGEEEEKEEREGGEEEEKEGGRRA